MIEWLAKVQTGLAYMGLTIPMLGVQLLGAILVVAGIGVVWLAQRSADNPFDAAQMFQDDNRRTSGSKFLGMIAGLASVWIVVYLTVSDKLDATLFIGWLGIVVLGKVGSEWVAAKAPPPEPPTLTDVVRAPDPRKDRT